MLWIETYRLMPDSENLGVSCGTMHTEDYVVLREELYSHTETDNCIRKTNAHLTKS